jgi:hypothetical protein
MSGVPASPSITTAPFGRLIQRESEEKASSSPDQSQSPSTGSKEMSSSSTESEKMSSSSTQTGSRGLDLDSLAQQVHPLVNRLLTETANATSDTESQQVISGLDLDVLSRRVYPAVKRMLSVDLERLSRV